ncbi:collagen-like protein [Lactiplantibacillus plantarum]|uniref:collagen-like protein n=1 Tax=Lactiplantibacillus plantarum TaxID=1590 RepID=UPI0019560F76|nr:collagen-like protein [Lactiplantibacillus plantarum]QRQ98824.1 hypothetical protein Lp900_02648 [Lactiplantibacillus plantarum]
MTKTLSFTDTSPQTVKIGDTTTSFTLVCGNDNVATDLTNVTSITVKLGNDSGYLKSATVDPASLTDPTTGQVTVKFTADLMNSLPAGSYALEVWVVDSTGTSIYPSDGSTGFNITNNIQSANGSTITTITFDDFVQAMKEAASTIKGEKGDTGTVDNAGLTTAPAFVALQTQVNNSAVGTNLLTGTSGGLQTKQLTNAYNLGPQATNGNYQIKLVGGQTYTYRAWLDNTNGSAPAYVNARFTPIGGTDFSLGTGTHIDNGKAGYSTFLIKPSQDGYACFIPFAYTTRQTCSAGWKEEKLEVGSVSTPWSLNPTEILTQSDYAKIKAAIVALGGSLS